MSRQFKTREELLAHFPNANESILRANGFDNPRPVAIPECPSPHETLATNLPAKENSGRILVRLTSVRKRLLDEDNLVSKFHVDILRYAGLLHSDAPGDTKIETTQRKAKKGEAEHTIIEIYPAGKSPLV